MAVLFWGPGSVWIPADSRGVERFVTVVAW